MTFLNAKQTNTITISFDALKLTQYSNELELCIQFHVIIQSLNKGQSDNNTHIYMYTCIHVYTCIYVHIYTCIHDTTHCINTSPLDVLSTSSDLLKILEGNNQ